MTFSPLEVTPLLQVFDMSTSLAFYRDTLGFEVISASPEVETAEGRFSHWMLLSFGPIRLMLNTQYDSNERPARVDRARAAAHGDTNLFIACSYVDVAYEEMRARGLRTDPPELAPYGRRRFSVVDPDGYGITFQEAG